MSQHLVVVTECDIDSDETGASVTAEEVVWKRADDDDKIWVVDLCDRHRNKTTLAMMPNIIEQYGRPLDERRRLVTLPESTPAAPRREVEPGPRVYCPYPDCGRDYVNRTSLMGHFLAQHGVRLSVWEAEQKGETNFLYCTCGQRFASNKALVSHFHAKGNTNEHQPAA